jgi:hypothetical protein
MKRARKRAALELVARRLDGFCVRQLETSFEQDVFECSIRKAPRMKTIRKVCRGFNEGEQLRGLPTLQSPHFLQKRDVEEVVLFESHSQFQRMLYLRVRVRQETRELLKVADRGASPFYFDSAVGTLTFHITHGGASAPSQTEGLECESQADRRTPEVGEIRSSASRSAGVFPLRARWRRRWLYSCSHARSLRTSSGRVLKVTRR